jgi:hypothetical protein
VETHCVIGVMEYWSTGVLEYWSAGVLEYCVSNMLDFDNYVLSFPFSITPLFHHSTTPFFISPALDIQT